MLSNFKEAWCVGKRYFDEPGFCLADLCDSAVESTSTPDLSLSVSQSNHPYISQVAFKGTYEKNAVTPDRILFQIRFSVFLPSEAQVQRHREKTRFALKGVRDKRLFSSCRAVAISFFFPELKKRKEREKGKSFTN